MLKAIETHELVVYMWEANSPGESHASLCMCKPTNSHSLLYQYYFHFILFQKTNHTGKMWTPSSTDSMRYSVVLYVYVCFLLEAEVHSNLLVSHYLLIPPYRLATGWLVRSAPSVTPEPGALSLKSLLK